MSSPGSSPSTGRSSFLVHIGPRKTGTSSIQHALQSRRDALRAQGVVYPGSGSQHHTVVNRFLGRRQMWEVDLEAAVEERPWRRMLREVGDAPWGVVSTEVLSQARPDHVRRLIDSVDGREPTVVVTYRPLEELLPSTWQQLVKEGLREPLDSWSRSAVGDHPERSDAPFPRVLDLATLVETWGAVVGPQNVAIVLVDRNHPGAIFEAFEQLLGLPKDLLGSGATGPRKRSLSAQEAELLRQTNTELPRDAPAFDRYRLYRKRVLAGWLNDHPPAAGDTRLTAPTDVVAAARERSRHMVDHLQSMPAPPRIFGDLETLVPTGSIAADDPPPQQVSVLAAAQLLAGAIRLRGTGAAGSGTSESDDSSDSAEAD